MAKENNIYYKLYSPSGLINQLYSAELASCFSFLTDRNITVYNVKGIGPHKVGIQTITTLRVPDDRKHIINNAIKPSVFDLIQIPNIEKFTLIDDNIPPEIHGDVQEAQLISLFHNVQHHIKTNQEYFSEGRGELFINPNTHLHLNNGNLSVYSRMFFNRTLELDKHISQIQFKKVYLDFAKKVADKLGKFRGMHIRLTDFRPAYYYADEQRFLSGLEYFQDNNLPLVVSTDDRWEPYFKNYPDIIFLDKFITDEFGEEFKYLPYTDEVTFAAICNLVMGYATEFVGTPGSTFTGHIQRSRMNRGLFEPFNLLWCEPAVGYNPVDKPFSWNTYGLDTGAKNWWREWKECKIDTTNYTEVVKEFKTHDGLGAMLWKKIYAMSFAHNKKLIFEDTPLTSFIVTPSDGVQLEEQIPDVVDKFNDLLHNPWASIDFTKLENKKYNTEVGGGAVTPPGFTTYTDFLLDAPTFNKIDNDDTNNIVIHLRRSNTLPHNPRYIPDEFYVNMLSQIQLIVDKFDMGNPNIILCTDAPDFDTTYKPISISQKMSWNQPPFLTEDENGEFELLSANFDAFKQVCPNLIIVNNLSTYDSFILMLRAKVLITAYSAFSQSAGLLSKNKVIGLPERGGISKEFSIFKNKVGTLDEQGNIILY